MRILYLDLDTLRPDHLGCYGYHRNTSPNIDAIAANAIRFNNYYCSDAPCLPSRTALTTGQFGIHTGVVNHGGSCADIRREGESRQFRDHLLTESLPGYLRTQVGLKTVSISPFASRHSAWHFYAGFDEMHDTGQLGMESAEEVTPEVLTWIRNNASQDDWFLHVNYWDAHTPYRAPEAFGNPFESEPLPEWLTAEVVAGHQQAVGPHCARELSMYDNKTKEKYPRQPGEIRDVADLRRVIDGYDCGIRYVDDHIGEVMTALSGQGVLDDLIVIVSADHGENLGELGIYSEHATADQSTCRVPMLIRWPGYTEGGKVDDALHYGLDLAPTLAEMFERKAPARWDGKSYASTLTEGTEAGHEYLVVSQCAHVCQRAVRFEDWIYVRTYHDGYHLFPTEMLFDIRTDPHEQNNLAEDHRDVCVNAMYKLGEWHEMMMHSNTSDTDPLWTVMREGGPLHARGHLRAYCEFLRETDREWAIPELTKRHPREFGTGK